MFHLNFIGGDFDFNLLGIDFSIELTQMPELNYEKATPRANKLLIHGNTVT